MKSIFNTLFLLFHITIIVAQVPVVKYTGQMKYLHRDGNATASLLIDTILSPHLFGIGPVEHLQGEIIIWDGRPFVAGILGDKKQPFVTKDVKNLKAIFLVYADVEEWDTLSLTITATTLRELEQIISKKATAHGLDTTYAFPFLLLGKVAKGEGHIVFAESPTAHIKPGTLDSFKYYNSFTDQKVQIMGFYSQNHPGIFTHHGSYLHIHYRLFNKYQAGHLDEISLDAGEPVKLMLPRLKNKKNQ